MHHYIDANTDFHQLQRDKRKVWFCNDIDALGDSYDNTSNNPKYKSVIVWPIITRSSNHVTGNVPIVAFLCLDSETPGAFSQSDHVPIGWVLADAMGRGYEALIRSARTVDESIIINEGGISNGTK
ncbi:hypothetical protein SAMN05444157_0725 [Frankineae bacterium MT45]|nr:hypothetical protein SAMN05444157_0725 [Frankineae bacterium MT45]